VAVTSRTIALLLSCHAALACGTEGLDPSLDATSPPDALAATRDAQAATDAGSTFDAQANGDAAAATVPRFTIETEDPRTIVRAERAPRSFERVVVTLHDRPADLVTLVARSGGFRSESRFAGGTGDLDLSLEAPLEGSYAGVDPDGPFWSMEAKTSTSQLGYRTYVVALVGTQTVATAQFDRIWTDPAVRSEPFTPGGLVGHLFLPPGPGPHPVVILLGGSEGGIEWSMGAGPIFASLGYASLGLAYFGLPGLPPSLSQVPLEYFETAIDELMNRPEIDGQRIGVFGGSRGGELALLIGATFPQIRGVVASVPSGVIWGDGGAGFGGRKRSSWTRDRQNLPWIPYSGAMPTSTVGPDGLPVVAYTPQFLEDLAAASTTAVDAATIRVEDTAGPILLIGGEDDQLWPSCVLQEISAARLRAAGHDHEQVCYPRTGHWIGFPGLPTRGSDRYFDAYFQRWNLIGGTPDGMAHAQRDQLGRLVRFLDRSLAPR